MTKGWSAIDDYYDNNTPQDLSNQYKNNLGPTLQQLKKYQRPGEKQITRVMLNKALSAEAAGTRAANEQASRASQAAFGSNPSALNTAMAHQANLASQRPVITSTVEASKPNVTANIGQGITNTMMAKPAYINASLQPYFANEQAVVAQEQLDLAEEGLYPPQAESPGFGQQLLGTVLGAVLPGLLTQL